MTVPGIHPENLLDKFAADELSPSEDQLLQAHLASCVVCRLELKLRADFEIDSAGLDFDQHSTRRLLGAVRTPSMAEVLAPQSAGEKPADEATDTTRNTEVPLAAPARPRSGRARIFSLTIAAVALASGAAALVASGGAPEPTVQSPAVTTEPASLPPRAVAVRTPPQPEPEAPASEEVSTESKPEPAREPQQVVASKSKQPPTPRPRVLTAAQLFAQANQARRDSNRTQATRLYHELQREFPGSSEARLSLVTLGTLQLDGGSASSALATFDRYLQRGGPLTAEALYGRARALRRLGRPQQEAQAWRTLLNRYPGSGYAKQARQRLSALQGR